MTKYTDQGKQDTRSGYGAGMTELGRTNPNVVALCADLVGSLKIETFIEENPERFVQVGIAEANMMGIAAGLTIGGKIPFASSFANFALAFPVRRNVNAHPIPKNPQSYEAYLLNPRLDFSLFDPLFF